MLSHGCGRGSVTASMRGSASATASNSRRPHPCALNSGSSQLTCAAWQAAKRVWSPEMCSWIAGHSLGGALATLAAYDLQAEFGFKELQCYTFGCPRTGNHAFAQDYERVVPDTWHVVNDRAPRHPWSNVPATHNFRDTHSTCVCCCAEDTVTRMAKFLFLYKR